MRAALVIVPSIGDALCRPQSPDCYTRVVSDSTGTSAARYSHYDIIIRATLSHRECLTFVQNMRENILFFKLYGCYKAMFFVTVSYHDAISWFIAVSIKSGLSLWAVIFLVFTSLCPLSSCVSLVSHVYYLTGHSSSKTEYLASDPRKTLAFSCHFEWSSRSMLPSSCLYCLGELWIPATFREKFTTI